MPELTPASLRTHIVSGQIAPLYLIDGGDDTEKTALAAAFMDTVEADLRAFNVERLYGGESGVTASAVVFAARTLPMMAARRIVLVLHAEKLLTPKREGETADRDADVLIEYFKTPEPLTALVFIAGPIDERRRAVKKLIEHGIRVKCGGDAAPSDAERWVREETARHGVTIEPKAAAALVKRAMRRVDNRMLADIQQVRGDLERLLLFSAGESITLAHVYEVASAAIAEGEFALVNAIERGAAGEALRELALQMEAGGVPYKILGQLAWYVRGRLRSGVTSAVEAVMRTDIALKTSAGDHRVLLERLVVELCDEKLRARVVRPGALF